MGGKYRSRRKLVRAGANRLAAITTDFRPAIAMEYSSPSMVPGIGHRIPRAATTSSFSRSLVIMHLAIARFSPTGLQVR